jgi:hypothetical protein
MEWFGLTGIVTPGKNVKMFPGESYISADDKKVESKPDASIRNWLGQTSKAGV